MNQEGSSRTSPLEKGKACFNCRRRKVKCDAKRPICSPCSQFIGGGLHDCEYTERGLAQSQVLQEKISIIESRIQEMEQPNQPRTSVGLHIPYQRPSLSSASTHQNPADVPKALFVRHAQKIGFFLNPHLFDGLSSGAAPIQLASPALLDTVYLWGAHLSRGDGDLAAASHEPRLLATALHSAASGLARAHTPVAVLHALQAELLLAQYLFRAARRVEGAYHAGVAVSIAIGAGLHKIRSRGGRVRAADELSPAVSAAEEGERINAFWAVIALNSCWLAASPASVDYAAVDTPWPLDVEEYSEDSQLLPRQSSATISAFLDGCPNTGVTVSLPALHAKAAIVFEQTTRLAVRCMESGIRTLSDEFNKLDNTIERLKSVLPAGSHAPARLLVVHTLAHAATIQLHRALARTAEASRTRARVAAGAIVALLHETDVRALGCVDAILGTLWTAACQVLVTELGRGSQQRAQCGEAVETLLDAMAVCGKDSRVIELQLETARQNYDAVRSV
ncbi:hypothetical protein GGX14DRAFT_647329 [Mycena pura]|uniref:Zn(2)-C6 fungal-type domain-containing protein n=1 Tax=Mycena pura TaxID=153505 RepID=A0AAD6YBU4_9AGAR|nr:hypothetical protein GGX14DRAFT_647329 [Mycena pura]